ncbi:hypothetical protein MTR_7g081595 [Medicago truncatula]|uniref:Uncharacterized protein n=1 Tax=Medicago truncatula TaxID=3880 RepID=A0A072UC44_MEDTR|nr:hypothetical protein MTR_7g081595 [Medicago truncatula]
MYDLTSKCCTAASVRMKKSLMDVHNGLNIMDNENHMIDLRSFNLHTYCVDYVAVEKRDDFHSEEHFVACCTN